MSAFSGLFSFRHTDQGGYGWETICQTLFHSCPHCHHGYSQKVSYSLFSKPIVLEDFPLVTGLRLQCFLTDNAFITLLGDYHALFPHQYEQLPLGSMLECTIGGLTNMVTVWTCNKMRLNRKTRTEDLIKYITIQK